MCVLHVYPAHTCLAQPLFIQTPLQVMLETLVEKLQLQADAISGMQDRVRPMYQTMCMINM
jgi:hypothetical protein